MTRPDLLRELMTLAYLARLEQRHPLPPLPPAELPRKAPRLDDTGRAPVVPLRATGGDGCRNCSSTSSNDNGHIYGEMKCCPECDHRA